MRNCRVGGIRTGEFTSLLTSSTEVNDATQDSGWRCPGASRRSRSDWDETDVSSDTVRLAAREGEYLLGTGERAFCRMLPTRSGIRRRIANDLANYIGVGDLDQIT